MSNPTPADARLSYAKDLLSFLDVSPTAWHATAAIQSRLQTKGFVILQEADRWELQPGGRYVVTRNGSSVIAFHVGSQPVSKEGFRLVGAHTDSPGLKLKPSSESRKEGLIQFNVEIYGGPILATWFNRDLALAGRLWLRDLNAPWGCRAQLVHLKRPLLSIPSLAIHFDRGVNDDGLKVNPQNHLPPILASQAGVLSDSALRPLLAAEIQSQTPEILGYDLFLCDLQTAVLSGLHNEYIHSGRIDNLAMSHAAITALFEATEQEHPWTSVAVCYDNEEIGSLTPQGADSTFLEHTLERIALSQALDRASFLQSLQRSFLLSADMAHATHPNWADKHDPAHKIALNAGPVMKTNAQGRYMADGMGEALFRRLCHEADVPCQIFASRTDLRPGTTIGPIAAGRLGLPSLDIGNPMLAMHSVREMAGSHDSFYMIAALRRFFQTPR